MITPPEEFEDYWALERWFQKYGGAIRHSIRGSYETATIRTIDDEHQSVQDFFYETKDGKMVMNKSKFPQPKYKTILEAPTPVSTVGQTPEPKKESVKGCDEPGCGDTHKHSVDENLTVKIDAPK